MITTRSLRKRYSKVDSSRNSTARLRQMYDDEQSSVSLKEQLCSGEYHSWFHTPTLTDPPWLQNLVRRQRLKRILNEGDVLVLHYFLLKNTLLPDEVGEVLCVAAERDDTILAQSLFKSGLDITGPEYGGQDALTIAAKHGSRHMTLFLLHKGVPVDSTTPLSISGTALQVAIRHDHQCIAKILLDAGADISRLSFIARLSLSRKQLRGKPCSCLNSFAAYEDIRANRVTPNISVASTSPRLAPIYDHHEALKRYLLHAAVPDYMTVFKYLFWTTYDMKKKGCTANSKGKYELLMHIIQAGVCRTTPQLGHMSLIHDALGIDEYMCMYRESGQFAFLILSADWDYEYERFETRENRSLRLTTKQRAELSTPRSLQRLCRVSIRQAMALHKLLPYWCKILRLQLPQRLKEFLLFKDLPAFVWGRHFWH